MRDLKAVADFAGVPLDGFGPPPEMPSRRLSEAIRELGRRMVEVERVKATVLQPLYDTRNALTKIARAGPVDVRKLEKAVMSIARGFPPGDDPVVLAYIEAITRDEVAW
jgi:hypothetical protein